MNKNKTINLRDGLQTSVGAAQLVLSAESLLSLITELKQAYLLYDFERLNKLTENQIKFYEEQQQKAEKILEDVKMTIDDSLKELEEHYYLSPYHKNL